MRTLRDGGRRGRKRPSTGLLLLVRVVVLIEVVSVEVSRLLAHGERKDQLGVWRQQGEGWKLDLSFRFRRELVAGSPQPSTHSTLGLPLLAAMASILRSSRASSSTVARSGEHPFLEGPAGRRRRAGRGGRDVDELDNLQLGSVGKRDQ